MPEVPTPDLPQPCSRRTLHWQLNGRPVQCEAGAATMLAELLRDTFQLTGTKLACDQAACGACTVRLDGEAVFACHTAALQCDGAEVVTIEGLAPGDDLHPLQQAFIDHDALQCGYCTPGMLMALVSALDQLRARGQLATRCMLAQAIAGNLCRCGAYPAILEAAMAVAGRPA